METFNDLPKIRLTSREILFFCLTYGNQRTSQKCFFFSLTHFQVVVLFFFSRKRGFYASCLFVRDRNVVKRCCTLVSSQMTSQIGVYVQILAVKVVEKITT